MHLVLDETGTAWRWTLYSGYRLPVAEGPTPYPSRDACLAVATEARGGAVGVPVVERTRHRAPSPSWPASPVAG